MLDSISWDAPLVCPGIPGHLLEAQLEKDIIIQKLCEEAQPTSATFFNARLHTFTQKKS